MAGGGDELLTALIDGGERWDPVEEQSALAQVQAGLFSRVFEPVALSRYVLLSPLGSGGGGIVYRAYDPDLHRKVAVKVLRTGEGSTALASRDRLLREAQAIAQLSHPNVVSVYDVGTLSGRDPGTASGPGVFMVMELIEGVDLRRWLREGRRSWRDVLEVFRAAGRGLAAAHEQGLVHRDFKPSNVLVGDDGRVRVLDFGLARAVAAQPPLEPDPPSAPAATTMLDHELTDVGAVMGTPAYMAPEQHLGRPADARTDQYCFCVALYEALADRRPFEGTTLEELMAAKTAGPPPLGTAAPRWLTDTVMRGLAVDPARRFSTMAQLLAALDRDPARRRRRAWQVAAMTAALGVGGYAFAQREETQGPACEDPGERLRGVWDDTAKEQAKRAFDATGLAYAADAWSGVNAALDAYATEWQAARTQACEATVVDREQSPEAMGLQMLCLDRQFESFAELARLVTEADQAVVRNAISATGRLPSPDQCRGASERMEARLDLRAETREQLLALDALLLRATVLADAGKYDDTRAIAEDVLTQADALDAHRARARALTLLCDLDWSTNRFQTAETRCEEALLAAERGQSAPLAFRAMLLLARVEVNLSQYGESERIFSMARARLQSIPTEQRDDLAEAKLALGIGLLRDKQWREEEALESLREALRLHEEALGPEHPELVPVLNGLGMVAGAQDRESAARDYYERALELSEASYGPAHPNIGSLLNNLGGTEYEQGHLDDALGSLTRSLELKQAQLGPDSPRLVSTLGRLARVLADTGRMEEALRHNERAVAVQESAQGPASPLLVNPLVLHARTLRILGRCDEAVLRLERAMQLVEAHPEANLTASSEAHFERAHCHLAAGDDDAALQAFERALAIEREQRGPDARGPATMLVEIAAIFERRGDAVGAVDRLERALRRCRATEGDPRLEARVEFALGRVLRPDDPTRSFELVRAARERMQGIDYAEALVAELDEWLEEHEP